MCVGERFGRGIVTDAITTPVVNTSAYFFNNTAQLIDFKVEMCLIEVCAIFANLVSYLLIGDFYCVGETPGEFWIRAVWKSDHSGCRGEDKACLNVFFVGWCVVVIYACVIERCFMCLVRLRGPNRHWLWHLECALARSCWWHWFRLVGILWPPRIVIGRLGYSLRPFFPEWGSRYTFFAGY